MDKWSCELLIPAGLYELLITDENNCTRTDQVIVEEPEMELTSSYQVENVTCYSGEDGSIQADILGGTTPYNYSWSNQDTTSSIDDLSMGAYGLSLTDGNNCLLIDTVIITELAR